MLKIALNQANRLVKEIDVIRITIAPYINHEDVQKMKSFVQHGHVSTFQHSINVVVISYILAKILNWKVDLSVLLIGALLHDFIYMIGILVACAKMVYMDLYILLLQKKMLCNILN